MTIECYKIEWTKPYSFKEAINRPEAHQLGIYAIYDTIKANPVKLRESLLKYSPIRLIKQMQAGEILVETGESRTPPPYKVCLPNIMLTT